jgi:hypothetical protein
MTFRRLTVLCWILLLVLPAAAATAADSLDLWVCGLTIVPLGDDEYMINPTICLMATEVLNDYTFDVRIEYGTEHGTEVVTIDADPNGIGPTNGCVACGDCYDHDDCDDHTPDCPEIVSGDRECLYSSVGGDHCYCKSTHVVISGPYEFPPGTIKIVIRADYGLDVPETNENNNDFTQYYTP